MSGKEDWLSRWVPEHYDGYTVNRYIDGALALPRVREILTVPV